MHALQMYYGIKLTCPFFRLSRGGFSNLSNSGGYLPPPPINAVTRAFTCVYVRYVDWIIHNMHKGEGSRPFPYSVLIGIQGESTRPSPSPGSATG